jgi:hypothetical protein
MTTIEPGERRIAAGFLAVAFALRALFSPLPVTAGEVAWRAS